MNMKEPEPKQNQNSILPQYSDNRITGIILHLL